MNDVQLELLEEETASDDNVAVRVPLIHEALANVMNDISGVGKNETNAFDKYKFRGIDATVNAVGPALRRHRVLVTPRVQSVNYREVLSSKGKAQQECTLTVEYVFTGPAGDTHSTVSVGQAMDRGDKATAKAMSVAFRIMLLQSFCIPTDDPDPDSFSYERGAPSPSSSSGYESFVSRIDDTSSIDDLRSIWSKVKAAYSAGSISSREESDLSSRMVAAKNALSAADK